METWDAIKARRNVREFEDRPLPEEHLPRGILLLGPTHIRVYALHQALMGRENFLFGRPASISRISRASVVPILPDAASR